MSVLVKEIEKGTRQQFGPRNRLGLALLALFAPGKAVVAVVKGFLRAVETLDEEERRALVAEIQDD